jgi:hypothetical protein
MKLTEVTHKQLEDALDAWNSGALTDEQWDTILVVLANAIRWSWVPTTTVMHMKAELARRPAPAPEPQNEALQKLCESLYCPAGINRVAFLANKIKDLQKRVKILQKQADGLCDGCSKPLEDAYCTKCSGRADLDWEPTKTRTVADMANIGNEYMDAVADLMPKANWDESPVELFSNLFNERPISPQEPA